MTATLSEDLARVLALDLSTLGGMVEAAILLNERGPALSALVKDAERYAFIRVRADPATVADIVACDALEDESMDRHCDEIVDAAIAWASVEAQA